MLQTRITKATDHALRAGALRPIATRYEIIPDGGVNFIVRVLDNLAHKEEADRQQLNACATAGAQFNPFLPYDRDLFVAELSETHVCLLNKYSVTDHHLLIVTREFEEQESAITARDFAALWKVLAEVDGLAFYNAGSVAGASQRHKHLQLVPLPLAPQGPRIPIETLIDAASRAPLPAAAGEGQKGSELARSVPELCFRHAFTALHPDWIKSPEPAGAETARRCEALLQALGLGSKGAGYSAYNLLLTRRWMLAVPRAQEKFENISVNALGFAGALLVRNGEQLARIRKTGPMSVLRGVSS